MVHDEEFTGLLDKADDRAPVLAWTDGDDRDDTVEALIAVAPRRPTSSRPSGTRGS